MKYIGKYHVEALSCPDCANHIIENLEKFNFITEVHIDYDSKEITIIGEKELSDQQAQKIIDDILVDNHCKDHNYGHLHSIVTEEFGIDIGCDVCAQEVEDELNKEKDIIDAKVNYATKKIIIKHLNNVEIYDVVSKTVSKVEEDASVYDTHESHVDVASCCHHHHHHDGCGCGHDHMHEDEHEKLNIFEKIVLIIGVLLYVASIIIMFVNGGDENLEYLSVNYFMFVGAYLLLGYDIIIKSLKGIIHGDIFNENFLMVIASLGSLLILEPFEATMVILLYKIGEALQDRATEKSKKSIMSLYDLKTEVVTMENGEVKNVKDVNVGDVITVKVGEKIPLDGVIKSEGTDVDMKALTGESRPVYIDSGAEILSGSINLTKVVNVEVTKEDSESTVSKMLKLVDEASAQKAKTEQFITKFARIYTPMILLLALIIGIIKGFILKQGIDTLNDVFSVLVIGCPCALVISIPLGYFAGIGRLSSLGILAKGGNYLEILAKSDTFVFDKTGTITKGNFKVCEINEANGHNKEEILERVAEAEYYSSHPIAQSIQTAYGKEINSDEKFDIEEIQGLGLKVMKNGNEQILVGNRGLMERFNIIVSDQESVGTVLYLAVNREYYGNVVIRDEVKETSKDLITKLNIKYQTVMLTGDAPDVAALVASEVGIKEYKAQLLPKNKYDYLKTLIKENKKGVVYIGDGINDAPALRIADVGIAMGGVGSDSAKEAADIVIMNDDLTKIDNAVRISKYTNKIILENVIFALSFKLFALIVSILGIFGSFAMILAVFADVGVCLLAIINTLRILKAK